MLALKHKPNYSSTKLMLFISPIVHKLRTKLSMEIEKQLKPRREPSQERSKKRAQQIMDVTALLLDRVGFDDLTTILITKELGISVGSLYHYFPNKHAILRSLAESWLRDWDKLLDEISRFDIEDIQLEALVNKLTRRFKVLYLQQKGILPLVHAMYAVPELRDLDAQHDKLVASRMTDVFIRMGFKQPKSEINRIASIYLSITHSMMLDILEQRGTKAERSLMDLNAICIGLLKRHIHS